MPACVCARLRVCVRHEVVSVLGQGQCVSVRPCLLRAQEQAEEVRQLGGEEELPDEIVADGRCAGRQACPVDVM